jgi:hypothetical protein
VLDNITWHHGFRFLGVSEPRKLCRDSLENAPEAAGKHSIDARKLFS